MTEEQRAWVESKLNTLMSYGESSGGGKGTVVDYKPDSVGMGVFFIIHPRRQRGKTEDVDYQEHYVEYPGKLLKASQRGVRPRGRQRSNGAPLRLVSDPATSSRAASSRWHGAQA